MLTLLVATPAWAQVDPDRMSGAALLEAFRGTPGPNDPAGDAGRQIATARAAAYVEGVLDAGVPRCRTRALLPHERNARIVDFVARLHPDRQRGPAAALIREALRC